MVQFRTSFLQSRGLTENERTTEEVLELKHLGSRAGTAFIPNLACVLLFAKDPLLAVPGCRVRVLRFEGEQERTGEKYNAVKDYWIDGPVPKLIVDSEAVIQGQLREFSRLGPDGKFYTAPEYPKPAWYEALVNACVHRSYNLRNMNVFVRMFDDRIEVESPGGFPGIVTPQNIYEIHEPRNPFLMEAMYYLRFVKCAREGTRRMRETMKSFALPAPEFSQAGTSYDVVKVILRNNIKQRKVWIDSNVGSLIGEALFESLSEDERRALNFVAENGRIGVSQLQRLTGRSWPAAKKVLEALERRGVLEHHVRDEVDRDPNAHYTLRRNGQRKGR
jgi:ATP-dependent DNA helicase RecG